MILTSVFCLKKKSHLRCAYISDIESSQWHISIILIQRRDSLQAPRAQYLDNSLTAPAGLLQLGQTAWGSGAISLAPPETPDHSGDGAWRQCPSGKPAVTGGLKHLRDQSSTSTVTPPQAPLAARSLRSEPPTNSQVSIPDQLPPCCANHYTFCISSHSSKRERGNSAGHNILIYTPTTPPTVCCCVCLSEL